MKKRILTLVVMTVVGISSAFSAMNFLPLEASSGDGKNQVIGSLFYLGTMSSNVSASSVGIAAFYQNKMSDNIGIYANGGVGKALSFKFDGSTNYNNSVAVFLQTGPYYIIPIDDNMLVKTGGGLDISILGAKEKTTNNEAVVLAFGAGVFGSFEYTLAEKITLVASLNLGFDLLSWKTDSLGDFVKYSKIITNIMPAVGASYRF